MSARKPPPEEPVIDFWRATALLARRAQDAIAAWRQEQQGK